jgi:hypothetical protein
MILDILPHSVPHIHEALLIKGEMHDASIDDVIQAITVPEDLAVIDDRMEELIRM